MGLFSWLFGRKKRKIIAQDPEHYIYFEPDKSTVSDRGGSVEGWRSKDKDWSPYQSITRNRNPNRNIPPTKEIKKSDPNYWDSQDFYPYDNSEPFKSSGSHLSDHSQHQAPSSSFGGFDAGSFAGGGGSGSWDQESSGFHTGSHGHQSSHDSSSHDTGGGISGYDSGSSDSGGGDSGDCGGGGD